LASSHKKIALFHSHREIGSNSFQFGGITAETQGLPEHIAKHNYYWSSARLSWTRKSRPEIARQIFGSKSPSAQTKRPLDAGRFS
jgi:hypothetical protein